MVEWYGAVGIIAVVLEGMQWENIIHNIIVAIILEVRHGRVFAGFTSKVGAFSALEDGQLFSVCTSSHSSNEFYSYPVWH